MLPILNDPFWKAEAEKVYERATHPGFPQTLGPLFVPAFTALHSFSLARRNQSYQVQAGDKDLLTLSARLEADYNALKNANPSITSISTGQYINLPKTTAPANRDYLLNYFTPQPGGAGSFLGGGNTIANANTQYKPPRVFGPTSRPTRGGMPTSSPLTASASANYLDPKNEARVSILTNRMMNATSFEQLPSLVSVSDATHAGFSSDKMMQAGYTLKNGNWVRGSTPPTTTGGPQTGNNWQTNPTLHIVTFNRNAKNKRNRFATTEKWATNAYKRKRRGGTAPAGPDIRADAPSTVLNLILGY